MTETSIKNPRNYYHTRLLCGIEWKDDPQVTVCMRRGQTPEGSLCLFVCFYKIVTQMSINTMFQRNLLWR